jgi:hypothetical protein
MLKKQKLFNKKIQINYYYSIYRQKARRKEKTNVGGKTVVPKIF